MQACPATLPCNKTHKAPREGSHVSLSRLDRTGDTNTMAKIFIAFVVIAGAALYMLSKGGDISMGGEQHGVETHAPETPQAPAQK